MKTLDERIAHDASVKADTRSRRLVLVVSSSSATCGIGDNRCRYCNQYQGWCELFSAPLRPLHGDQYMRERHHRCIAAEEQENERPEESGE